LKKYADLMKEGRKDIFAFPLNLPMLALNCMRGGLHGVSALGLRFAHGVRDPPVFHLAARRPIVSGRSSRGRSSVVSVERVSPLAFKGSVARGARDCPSWGRADRVLGNSSATGVQ